MDNNMRGRIKSLKKNYGFIQGENGIDHFFHWTFLVKESKTFNKLSVGDTVDFVPKKIEDKDHATEIRTLD